MSVLLDDFHDEAMLTADQVAEVLGVTVRYVWRLGREGRLDVVAYSRRCVRYPAGGVRAFLADGRKTPDRGREPVAVGAAAARLQAHRERRPVPAGRRRERLR